MVNVYTDTSVIGGCFEPEFQEWSEALLKEFKAGSKKIIISDLMLLELSKARPEIHEKLNEVPLGYRIHLRTTEEAIMLAETYISEGALTNKSYNDALHIALATINNAEVLASWNFKHIVNLNRIRLYNSINLRLGYRLIEIRTPREILNIRDHEKG
ncbi:PIN domain-containing protein [Chitinophaga barathri]|uniref:PIN domain-containing protein n=1 Tax=Chitinophaga barathri TaxID=1647451 RepID=A0A3N4MH72_9BACT|nr:PIN domain-containing protein [Chitinophaga barathri]RPD39440.1 PIN domain-containing protein [Chitinophaga barathri]